MSQLPIYVSWCCENCGCRLALVINGQARVKGRVVFGSQSVAMECPSCGHLNLWRFAEELAITLDKCTQLC